MITLDSSISSHDVEIAPSKFKLRSTSPPVGPLAGTPLVMLTYGEHHQRSTCQIRAPKPMLQCFACQTANAFWQNSPQFTRPDSIL